MQPLRALRTHRLRDGGPASLEFARAVGWLRDLGRAVSMTSAREARLPCDARPGEARSLCDVGAGAGNARAGDSSGRPVPAPLHARTRGVRDAHETEGRANMTRSIDRGVRLPYIHARTQYRRWERAGGGAGKAQRRAQIRRGTGARTGTSSTVAGGRELWSRASAACTACAKRDDDSGSRSGPSRRTRHARRRNE